MAVRSYQLGHLPTQQEVLAIAEKWRPYRSLATSYLFSAAFDRTAAPPVVPSEAGWSRAQAPGPNMPESDRAFVAGCRQGGVTPRG